MALLHLTKKNSLHYLPEILEIEANARYPLGNDFFSIDHGKNYFAFFTRLGECRYYAWLEKKRVVGVIAVVLRKVPVITHKQPQNVWYLCDLKIHPAYRGRKIPVRMMCHLFFRNYFRCMRGYAISMNSQHTENRMARIAKHFRLAKTEVTQLNIWSLSANEMLTIQPLLKKHRGEISYLSLEGIKNIVMESTQKPLPIRHVQFGPLRDKKGDCTITDDAVYMFCAPQEDTLAKELFVKGYEPSSSASVISHRMQTDWRWILTSDI